MPEKSALARLLPIVPKSIVRKVSRRYIAGDHLDDALSAIKNLNASGVRGTIDILGEFIDRIEQARAAREIDFNILDGIRTSGVDANLSVKLSSLGLKIDFEFCCAATKAILERAAGKFVRLDMEDSSCTDLTLNLYRRMRAEGFTNVGVVLQAYMRRTAADIDALPADHLNVRLCKGIYVEPEAIAFKPRVEVQNNYTMLLRKLVDKGAYVGIATHDDVLIDDAYRLISDRGLPKTSYEFQMLLGVREDKRTQIVRDGHGMRVYVPFGEQWYGYSMRRLQENPKIAVYIIKAMFGLDT